MGDGVETGLTTGEPYGLFVFWALSRHPKDLFADHDVERMIRLEFPNREHALGGRGAYQRVSLLRSYARNQPERLGKSAKAQPEEVLARIDRKMRRGEDLELDPSEVAMPALYLEGAIRSVSVNAYERDPRARKACLDHHGFDCAVCGFNFRNVYGEIGEAFIHVHHLRDLATVGGEYEVDPIEELRPVCPNCHAMLHREVPAMSVSKLRSIVLARR